MVVYRVFYKDYDRKACRFIGELRERRRDLRGMTHIQTGLKWAKRLFGECVRNHQALLVVPREHSPEHEACASDDQDRRSFVLVA